MKKFKKQTFNTIALLALVGSCVANASQSEPTAVYEQNLWGSDALEKIVLTDNEVEVENEVTGSITTATKTTLSFYEKTNGKWKKTNASISLINTHGCAEEQCIEVSFEPLRTKQEQALIIDTQTQLHMGTGGDASSDTAIYQITPNKAHELYKGSTYSSSYNTLNPDWLSKLHKKDVDFSDAGEDWGYPRNLKLTTYSYAKQHLIIGEDQNGPYEKSCDPKTESECEEYINENSYCVEVTEHSLDFLSVLQ